jgi:hypothetical protein
MQAVSGFTRKLASGGLVAGLTVACCLAGLSMAQNSPAPPTPSRTAPDESPRPLSGQPKTDLPPATIELAADAPAPSQEPAPQLAVPALAPGERIGSVSGPNSSQAPTLEADDPEKVAKDFLEQNQKQAETQLKNLKDEAEKLRTRLQKVEAGIKRWETLLGALKQSQVTAGIEAPEAPKGDVEHRRPDAPGSEPTARIDGPDLKASEDLPTPSPKAEKRSVPRS